MRTALPSVPSTYEHTELECCKRRIHPDMFGICRRTTLCSPLRTRQFKVPLASLRSSSYVSQARVPRHTRKETKRRLGSAFRQGSARGFQLGRSALQRGRWYSGPCCRQTSCTSSKDCNQTLTTTDRHSTGRRGAETHELHPVLPAPARWCRQLLRLQRHLQTRLRCRISDLISMLVKERRRRRCTYVM